MAVREWFEALAPREKWLVTVAGALAILAVAVIGLIRPLASSRHALGEQLAEKRAILADIERVAARLGQAGGTASPANTPSGESLVVLIDRTTRARGLGGYLKRNEPDGTSSIRLRFENVPFDELVTWLVEIQASQAVSVVSASADPGQGVGRVSANLQLSRAVLR
jgi:general secretion pathway protein M